MHHRSLLLKTAASLATLAMGVQGQASTISRSFYGMAYSPEGALLPHCGASQVNVTRDMTLISQLTPHCNQTALVLQGIKEAGNVDLSVWLGIFIDGNDTVYQRQMDAVTDAITKYGTDHIAGITVGNEYLLLSYGDGGTPTDAKGVAARTNLLKYIQQTNQTIQAMGLKKNIPIGTADAGSAVTKELCAGTDYVMANVHPWFGHVPIEQSAVWTWQFFQDFDVKICDQAANKPIMYIAETGWPTTTDNASIATNGASAASIANLQVFMDTFVCQANANATNYFFFEYKDEMWKKIYGGVEPYWGLYDSQLNFKNVKVPNCPVTSPTGRSVVPVTDSTSVKAGTIPSGATATNVAGAGAKKNFASSNFVSSGSTLLYGLALLGSLFLTLC